MANAAADWVAGWNHRLSGLDAQRAQSVVLLKDEPGYLECTMQDGHSTKALERCWFSTDMTGKELAG
jgi:hypothetical protein